LFAVVICAVATCVCTCSVWYERSQTMREKRAKVVRSRPHRETWSHLTQDYTRRPGVPTRRRSDILL